MSKSVTISARVSEEDAEFISQLKIDGAITPSDKVRAIIADTRRQTESRQDYPGCMAIMQSFVGPAGSRLRELEAEHRIHSELITRTLDWLPDAMAFAVTSGTVERNATSQLEALESGLADRIFRLMESVLQMGVTPRCSCYDSGAIRARVEPILDLVRVINTTRQLEEEQRS